MTTPIEDFILERLEEIELNTREESVELTDGLHKLCHAIRMLIEWHKTWPVLVEGPIETERMPNNPSSPDEMVYRMTKQIQWMTNAEYIKRFGVDSPTAPIIVKIANIWRDHPDFNRAWAVTDESDIDVPASRVGHA